MNEITQLREQMWDLIYGLLEPEEKQALVARIKSDPQAARLYAEVRLQADLVGYASKIEDSSLVLSADGKAQGVAPVPASKSSTAAAAHAPASKERGGSRAGSWLAGIAAAALAVLVAVGLYWPQAADQHLARSFVVVDIGTPQPRPAGLSNNVPIQVTDLDGVGQQAEGHVVLRDEQGRESYRQDFTTSDVGRADIDLPGEALQPGAQLEVSAVRLAARYARQEAAATNEAGERDSEPFAQRSWDAREGRSTLTAALPVREEPQVAYLMLENPVVEPGKSSRFGLWSFGAFSREPAPAAVTGAAVEDLEGTVVAEPMWTVDAERGIVMGDFAVPESSTEVEKYALAFRADDHSFFRAPVEGLPAQLGQGVSGKAAGLDDLARTYHRPKARFNLPREAATDSTKDLVAKEALAEKVADEGATEAKKQAEQGQLAGMGPALDPAKNEAGSGAARKYLEVEIPADRVSRPLVASVRIRGIEVATTPIEPATQPATDPTQFKEDASSGRMARIDVPPEVNGPVNVLLFDRSISPPELVQQQVVHRESARKLHLELLDGKTSYQPGEQVSLNFQVTDETGQPAAGALAGVRVWNERYFHDAAEQPPLLVDAMRYDARMLSEGAESLPLLQARGEADRLDERAKDAQQLANSYEYRSQAVEGLKKQLPADGAKSEAESMASGGALAPGSAGGFGASHAFEDSAVDHYDAAPLWPGLPEGSTLATNRPKVAAEYDAAVALAADERQKARATIGRILVFGGCGALLLIGILALLKLPAKARIVVPSLLVTAASLVVGLGWIGWAPVTRLQQLAMVSPEDAARTDPSATTATPPPPATPAEHALDLEMANPRFMGGAGAGGGEGIPSADFAPAGGGSPANAPYGAVVDPAEPAPLAAPAESPPAALGSTLERQRGGANPARDADAALDKMPKPQAEGATTREQNARKNEAPAPTTRRPALVRPLATQPATAAAPGPPAAAESLAPAAEKPTGPPSAGAPGRPAKEGKASASATAPDSRTMRRAVEAGAFDSRGEKLDRVSGDKAIADAKLSAAKEPFGPPSLYFNPRLITDAQGRATIEFTMPAAESEYRILIDALANGRIGSLEQVIECKSGE